MLAATLGVSSRSLVSASDVRELEGPSSELGDTSALAVDAALRKAALTLYGETLDRRLNVPLESDSARDMSTERDVLCPVRERAGRSASPLAVAGNGSVFSSPGLVKVDVEPSASGVAVAAGELAAAMEDDEPAPASPVFDAPPPASAVACSFAFASRSRLCCSSCSTSDNRIASMTISCRVL